MAQLQKGTTYITGDQVTAANLNALVDSGILTPGAVTDQTAKTVPLAADTILLHSAADTALRKTTMTQLFATPQPLGATTPSSVAATTGTFSSTLGVTGVATLGNGAILGTPASGTVTNLTGTASININGTVGATTPSSVAATTISASGQITSTIDGAKYLSRTGTSITQQFQEVGNTGGNYQLGVERSTGGALVVGGTAYATVLTTTGATNIEFGVNVQKVAALTSTGLNSCAIGATTPSTGAFTTLSATGTITSTIANGEVLVAASATTGTIYARFQNTGGASYIGLDNSAGGAFGTGAAYALVSYVPTGRVIENMVNGATITTVSSTGLAVTGALSATSTITGTGITASTGLRASGAIPSNLTSNSVYDFFSNTSRFFSFGDVSTEGQFLWYTGLGAASPTQRMGLTSTGLAVTGTLSATGNVTIASASNQKVSVQITDSGNDRNAELELLSSGNGGSEAKITFGDTDATPGTPSPLCFYGYHSGVATKRMTIDSSGNVGIGTASPTSRLHVTDAGAGASGYATKSNGGIFNGRTSTNISTTAVTLFTMSAGSDGGLFLVIGDDGSNGFSDIVIFSLNAVSVVSSNTSYGSPPARTYSGSSTAFRLALASGNLNVRTAMLIATA